MDIGIVGSGRIGATVARLAVDAGHDVAIANSRGPESLAGLVAELGRARAVSVDDAARFGELVLVAVPFHAALALSPEPFAGKAVIDANNYFAGRDGAMAALEDGTSSSSELLAAHLADARIVKAFNALHYQVLAADSLPGAPLAERIAVPVAGDDAQAKALVARFVEGLGFAPLDTGSLSEGDRLQGPGAPLFNRPLRLVEAERELAVLRAGG